MKKLLPVGLGLIISISGSSGALYNGNGNTSSGGAIGNGSLSLTANSSTVSLTFTKGSGSFNDVLVLFIDSPSGGFTTTTLFSDNSSALPIAISGLNSAGDHRSTANFSDGFTADYAVAIGVNQGAAVYKLANGTSFGDPIRTLHGPFESPNVASYAVSFDWVDIGLARGSGNTINFETSYITATGSRSLESFEGFLSGSTSGYGTVNFGNYDSFPIAPVPEPANVALAIFGGIATSAGMHRRVRRFLRKKRVSSK